jgi:hypothetical protein
MAMHPGCWKLYPPRWRPGPPQPRAPRLPTTNIPADVLQIVTEYTNRVEFVLIHRRVSSAWRTAVSNAIGFLNGACWTSVDATDEPFPLTAHFQSNRGRVVLRCAMLCLRERATSYTGLRFRSLEEIGHDAPLAALTLRLLGDHNDTLVHLGIEGAVVRDAHVLQCYSALNSLSLGDVDHVTVSVLVHMLENVLETLSLNNIYDLRVEALARCPALRELSIGYGDYRVPVGNRLHDASPLEHSYSLRVLTMVNVPLSDTHTAVLARVAARGQVVITVDGREMFGTESLTDDDQHLNSSTAS